MGFMGQSRGQALSSLRPRVLNSGEKMGLPRNAYYVLTKPEASLEDSKLHPNSGDPNYTVVHNVSDLTAGAALNIETHDFITTGDFSDGTNATSAAEIAIAHTHVLSDGSDHGFIDQDVTSGSTPIFTGNSFLDWTNETHDLVTTGYGDINSLYFEGTKVFSIDALENHLIGVGAGANLTTGTGNFFIGKI